MTNITLCSVSELMPRVTCILDHVRPQLEALVPDAEPHHIGATSIPGAVTKGDVDVLLRVAPDRFAAAVTMLGQHFAIKQPANWTSTFASFGDDTGYELPLGIQVVVKESSEDFFLFLRDYLISNREALGEYNRLKMRHSAAGPESYWTAKDEFLTKILASRET